MLPNCLTLSYDFLSGNFSFNKSTWPVQARSRLTRRHKSTSPNNSSRRRWILNAFRPEMIPRRAPDAAAKHFRVRKPFLFGESGLPVIWILGLKEISGKIFVFLSKSWRWEQKNVRFIVHNKGISCNYISGQVVNINKTLEHKLYWHFPLFWQESPSPWR